MNIQGKILSAKSNMPQNWIKSLDKLVFTKIFAPCLASDL